MEGQGEAWTAPTARFNLWSRFCLNYSYNEPAAPAEGEAGPDRRAGVRGRNAERNHKHNSKKKH